MTQIFIFSAAVNSGKTSVLLDWEKRKSSVGGILSPKRDGQRYFYSIAKDEFRLLDDATGEIGVGKHRFSAATFAWAIEEFNAQAEKEFEWLILDEVGPLELKQELGFHALFSTILNGEIAANSKLIVVVRESALEEFIEKYKLASFEKIGFDFFKT